MSKTPSTAVATKDDALPAGMSQEELDALLQQQESEITEDFVTVPIFKIGQALTKEVQSDAAEVGEFIDSLQGEGVGTKIGFITSYYQPGRFYADRDTNKAYVAFGKLIPSSWADAVGEEWVDTPFSEHPDAEEMFKKAVNNKEREWGKGAPISTTHNFTGLAVIPGVDGEEDELRPARFSLQRTNNKAVSKWFTLKRSALRNRPFWDIVFDLGVEKVVYTRGTAYNLTVSKGRSTTPDERSLAAELAQVVMAGRVNDNSEPDAKTPAPNDNGGLAV